MSKIVLKKVVIEIDGEDREFGFDSQDLEKLYNILGAVLGKPHPGGWAYPAYPVPPYYIQSISTTNPTPYINPIIVWC